MANIGTIIAGKYKIEKMIGKGGMSNVYLALDTRLGKYWAIKEVDKYARDPQKNNVVIKSALAEADLIKDLDNYYLPRISDILDNGRTIFIVMDYVEGESLKSILQREGAQSQSNVIRWGKQLCQVLHYLHSRKTPVIYRDMKPGNVMIKSDGDIKLIDFGIARELSHKGSADEVNIGTRGYAAPEQFKSGARIDQRTDIYNLGATLYHAVTGHDPTKSPYEMKPIRSSNRTLSIELERIINKCTNSDPKRRYQTIKQLLEDLQKIGDDEITLPVQNVDDGETTILAEYSPPVDPVTKYPVSGTIDKSAAQGASLTLGAAVRKVSESGVNNMSTPSRNAGTVKKQTRNSTSFQQESASESNRKVKPIYIVLPMIVATAAVLIIFFTINAGHEPKDVMEIQGVKQGISSLALSWEPSDKADGYELMIAPDNPKAYDGTGKAPPRQPIDIKDNNIIIDNLLCDEAYTCEVRAYAEEDNKRIFQNGNSASIDIKTGSPDLSVSGLTISAIGYSASNVKWDTVQITNAAMNYHLVVSNEAIKQFDEKYNGTGTAVTVNGLVPATLYSYKVVASVLIDGKDFVGESQIVRVTSGAVQFSAPDLKVKTAGYSSINCAWQEIKVTDASITYMLQRSDTKAGTFETIYSGPVQDFTDDGLTSSKRYYYKVIAVANVSGNEYKVESKVVSAKTNNRPVATVTTPAPRYNPAPRPSPKPKPSSPNPDVGW